jgi:hypothetical protein
LGAKTGRIAKSKVSVLREANDEDAKSILHYEGDETMQYPPTEFVKEPIGIEFMQYSEYLSASEKKELDRLSSENISGENISVIETDETGEEEDFFFDARVDMVEQAIDEDQTEVVEEDFEQATDNDETESHGMTSTVQYPRPQASKRYTTLTWSWRETL